MLLTPPGRRHNLECEFGQTTFNCRVEGAPGPAILCIRGVWAPEDDLNPLLDRLPGHDVVIGDLPGMRSEPPRPCTIDVFARIFDRLVRNLLPGRKIVLIGSSTGALVALAMQSPEIVSRVLIEPFFSTDVLWPLIDYLQPTMIAHPEIVDYAYEVLGIGPERVDARRFAQLFDSARGPITSLVGEVPLGERRTTPAWPSFTDAAERRRLQELGELIIGPPGSGHYLHGTPEGLAFVLEQIAQVVAAVDPERRSAIAEPLVAAPAAASSGD